MLTPTQNRIQQAELLRWITAIGGNNQRDIRHANTKGMEAQMHKDKKFREYCEEFAASDVQSNARDATRLILNNVNGWPAGALGKGVVKLEELTTRLASMEYFEDFLGHVEDRVMGDVKRQLRQLQAKEKRQLQELEAKEKREVQELQDKHDDARRTVIRKIKLAKDKEEALEKKLKELLPFIPNTPWARHQRQFNRVPADESAAKESPAKESPAKKSPAKESPAKKSAAKKSAAKKSAVKDDSDDGEDEEYAIPIVWRLPRQIGEGFCDDE
jgi:hypothetical protein